MCGLAALEKRLLPAVSNDPQPDPHCAQSCVVSHEGYEVFVLQNAQTLSFCIFFWHSASVIWCVKMPDSWNMVPEPQFDESTVFNPKVGWVINNYEYRTSHLDRITGQQFTNSNQISLARDGAGANRGVQWCNTHGLGPTRYHGHWKLQDGALAIHFNCRGPGHPLRTTTVRRVCTPGLGPGDLSVRSTYFEGRDANYKHVQLIPDGSYQIRLIEKTDDGEINQVQWAKLDPMSGELTGDLQITQVEVDKVD